MNVKATSKALQESNVSCFIQTLLGTDTVGMVVFNPLN